MNDDASEWQWLGQRFPTRSAEETLARARRRTLAVVVTILLVALVVGTVAGIHYGHAAARSPSPGSAMHHRPRRHEPGLPWEISSFVMLLVGVVLEVVGVVRLYRRGIVRDNWRSPLLALPRRERRGVVAQVRGRRPARIEDLPLTRGAARRLANQSLNWPFYVGLVCMLVGQLLRARGVPLVFLLCVSAVAVIAVPFLLRDIRAGRRFLADHPADQA